MNSIKKKCLDYTFNFTEPSSLREVFCLPQKIVVHDATIAGRMNRWLIDNGDFCTRLGQYMNPGLSKRTFKIDNATWDGLCNTLDGMYLVESMAGECFYKIITSMVLRSIELFFQSTNHRLNFSVFHPNTQKAISFWMKVAVLGSTFCLGYSWMLILYVTILPLFLEKVLSYSFSNYFKEIYTLSSSKDFALGDFILKNIKVSLLRIIFATYLLLSNPRYFEEKFFPSMTLCKIKADDFTIEKFDADYATIKGLLLESVCLILGKVIFDLVYILILKAFSKKADLRDPMGWAFEKFRRPVAVPTRSFSYPKINLREPEKEIKGTNPKVISQPRREDEILITDDSSSILFTVSEDKAPQKREKYKKTKETKESKACSKSSKKTSNKPEEQESEINIEVGGLIRTFQKIESDTFINKEVWGIIIADSVEKSNLGRYEQQLSNGSVGGSIRPLTGFSKIYEIGTTGMDARLLGKMYDRGIYHALQSFMPLEDALQLSQQLEAHGIQDNMSLIIFSAEAKKHHTITRVANKL